MSTSILEIIQLANGNIVLKRADEDDDSEPLVSIGFSEESKEYIGDAGIDVARVMIQAGIQAVAHIQESRLDEEGVNPDGDNSTVHTLH